MGTRALPHARRRLLRRAAAGATDAFLSSHLGLTEYDRFYVPGGGGALASSGRDFIRAQQLRRECQYLITLHDVEHVLLLFHGPSIGGPPEAMCADYRRKIAGASPATIRARQARDAADLVERRDEWAGTASVSVYWCEVGPSLAISFRPMTLED
ncbi:MAG: hypothetical protein IT359_10570 [Gemmatimonadaceae bacterium]|nr:hypothetical protein [Gemmatimonadaceae bacterium]